MYWFRRPPYLRWTGAALLVAVALAAELRPTPTVGYPFATRDLSAGATLEREGMELRRVPAGLLPEPPPQGAVLRHPVGAGEPILPSAAGEGVAVPEGWWALPLSLPPTALPGASLRLVMVPSGPGAPPEVVPGLVVEGTDSSPDPLAYGEPTGLVAVPEEAAAQVAVAASEGRVVVGLTGP